MAAAYANEEAQYDYNGESIEITAKKPNNFSDDELDFLEKELGDIKNLKSGFEKKGTVLDELNTQAVDLDEQHKSYAKKRLEYSSRIERYKKQQACLNKTKDVDKCFKTQTDNFLSQFNILMSQNQGMFQECYQAGLNKDEEKTQGNVDFRFRFLPSGHVEHIDIVEKLNKSDRNLIRCIYSKVNRIKFPRTGKTHRLTVGKSFNFQIKGNSVL